MESTTAGDATFRREGEYWSIAHGEESLRLRDSKGLHYVASLLARPGHEVHVLDLVAAVEGRPLRTGDARRQAADAGLRESGLGDAGAALDAEARAAYKARLDELRDELEEAEAWNDPERAAKAREEMEFLAGELAGATGLAGRERHAGDPTERARQSVSKAVKVALERLSKHAPYLGRHLERNIHTGIFCRYDPDTHAPISWILAPAVGRSEVTRAPAGPEVPEAAPQPAARRLLLVGVAVAVAAVVAGGDALLLAISGDGDDDGRRQAAESSEDIPAGGEQPPGQSPEPTATATAAPTKDDAVIPSGIVLFAEDFNSGREPCLIGPNNVGDGVVTYPDETLELTIESPFYLSFFDTIGCASTLDFGFTLEPFAFSNVRVEVAVRTLAGDEAEAGLVCYASYTTAYYLSVVESPQPGAALAVIVRLENLDELTFGGDTLEQASVPPAAAYVPGGQNLLAAECVEGPDGAVDLSLLVNGHEVLTARDEFPLPPGAAGFGASSRYSGQLDFVPVVVRFDDFTVTSLGEE